MVAIFARIQNKLYVKQRSNEIKPTINTAHFMDHDRCYRRSCR